MYGSGNLLRPLVRAVLSTKPQRRAQESIELGAPTCKYCNLFDFALSGIAYAPRRRDGVHTMARGAASRWCCAYGARIDVPLERCDVAVGHVGICGERDLLRAFERRTYTMARSHIAWTTEWH